MLNLLLWKWPTMGALPYTKVYKFHHCQIIGIPVLFGVHAKNGDEHFWKEKFHAANGKKV
jgi:hypothetical protein